MLRLVLGTVAALAIVAVIGHSRGYEFSSHRFISANMPGIKKAESMTDCTAAITTNDQTFEWDPTGKAAKAVTGKTTGNQDLPFAVLQPSDLSGATMMGGCKCGSAVCTVGRLCNAATSQCFLPPCPTDGLAGDDAGKKKVPANYIAGCWCAAAGHFGEMTVGAAANIKLLPSPTEFGDAKTATICKATEFCDPDGGDSPVCTQSSAL